MIGGFEWYALLCIFGVIVGGFLCLLVGRWLANVFCGRTPGGRK